jgi:acetoin utilization deacetylase AcuC-like enzyme
VDAIREGIRTAGLEARLDVRRPRPATFEELHRVHTTTHVRSILLTEGRIHKFDADTQASPRSYEAALLAAGAVAGAVDHVLAGDLQRAFCIGRPPGHHAEAVRAMGFCLFNNVAVGAAHALAAGLERVLILDFDVHHGNGTQAIFWDEPRVLYVSSHAYPFYPGTGSVNEVGGGRGRGFTVNLPLPGGCGDNEYCRVYREVVEPIGRAFDPQLVLVSAGFDAYGGDPLAGMALTAKGYAELAAVCLDVAAGAAQGRAIFALEGGYHLEGLALSGAAVAGQLLGDEPPHLDPHSAALDPLLEVYRRVLTPFWPVLAS